MKSRGTLYMLLVVAFMGVGYLLARKHIPSSDQRIEKSKRVLDFKGADITQIQIRGVDRDFIFEKGKNTWSFKNPIKAAADSTVMEGILSSVEYLECRRELTPKDISAAHLSLADYGLDKPRLVVSFRGGKETITIHIGNEALGSGLYIQVEGDPSVYLVDKDIARKLVRKQEDYREKGLFDFRPSQVLAFEIRNGSKFLEFSRTNSMWRIVQPLNARANGEMVEQLLKSTGYLQVQEFLSDDLTVVKDYGLEDPPQSVTIRLEKVDAPIELLIGSKLKTDGTKTAAMLRGRNSIVAIPSSYGATVARSLNDFRDRNLTRFNPADVQEIILRTRQVAVVLRRDGAEWKIIQPETLTADPDLVNNLLTRLSTAQIKDFSSDVLTDLDKYGLKAPVTSIVLRGKPMPSPGGTNAVSAVFMDLALGKDDLSQKLSYVKLADESSIYGLDSTVATDLPRSLMDVRSRILFEIPKDSLRFCSQKKDKMVISVEKSSSQAPWKIADTAQGVLNETPWLRFQNLLGHFAVEKIVGTALNSTLKQYGLDFPFCSVTIKYRSDTAKSETGSDADRETQILVGRETPRKKFYVLWKDQLLVCEVSHETWKILTTPWLTKVSK